MAWRFSDRHAAPYGGGRPDWVHLEFDERFGRWRWAFQRVLKDARLRAGRDLSGDEAAAALEPELKLAIRHITAEPPDATVFGTIYVPGAARLAGGDRRKAVDSRSRALAVATRAADRSTADFLREGLMLGAAEVIRDVLRDHAPNDLGAAAVLVRCLHAAHADLDASAEWADRYCRVVSAASVCSRLTDRDPTRKAVLDTYEADLTTLLTLELESDALQLGVRRLIDHSLLLALPQRSIAIDELASYIRGYPVNWLRMVCQSPAHMLYFQLDAGTVGRVGESVRTLVKKWKTLGLATFTPAMKEVMLYAAEAVYQVLVTPLPRRSTEIRVAACTALGKIPLMETLDLLGKHVDDPDLAVQRAAREATLDILATLGIG